MSWRSYDVQLSASSPQASVDAHGGGTPAALEFYESTNDGGVAKDLLFGEYDAVHPQNWFNRMQAYWSTDGTYPYAGKSAVGRVVNAEETGARHPFGVMDLQLHPPQNSHLTVAAFVVPATGTYSVSDLGVRRIDTHGQTARLYLFDAQGQQLASLLATNNRAWNNSSLAYGLGTLHEGDRIYFAVGADGEYDYDATEISWQIDASDLQTTERVWNSYDADSTLPVDYFESGSGYPAPLHPFVGPPAAHPWEFNHLASYIAPAGVLYPYAGRSGVPRGSDTGESNAPAPLGVSDMQLHPPEGSGHTVAAFHVTQAGEYTLSDLALRRVDSRGDWVNLCVYVQGNLAAGCMNARNDRAWVRDSMSHNLGILQPGDTIYVAINNVAADYAFDAAEIAWKIHANFVP